MQLDPVAKATPLSIRRFRGGWAFLIALLLFTHLACRGRGEGETDNPALPAVNLTLEVPPLNLSLGSVGTTTLRLLRSPGLTAPVTVAISSPLPAGIAASLAQTTVTDNHVELTVEAGYLDPNLGIRVEPVPGPYTLTLTATVGTQTVTGTLSLLVVPTAPPFNLGLVTSTGSASQNTALSLTQGQELDLQLSTWQVPTTGPLASDPISFSLQDVPPGLTVKLQAPTSPLNDLCPLTIAAAPNLPNGTYVFHLVATQGTHTLDLPFTVTCANAPFWVEAPPQGLQIAQGGHLRFPLRLGRSGTFFVPSAGKDPAYLGSTRLKVDAPSLLNASLDAGNPEAAATVPLTLDASTDLTPGSYSVSLTATRTVAGSSTSYTTQIPITLLPPEAAPSFWVESVEWGQSILSPHLPLIPYKPTLLRVTLLASQGGLPAPAVSATVTNGLGQPLGSLALKGPLWIPVSTADSGLSSTYTALLEAELVQPGLTVTLQAGSLSQTLRPPVLSSGYVLPLQVVPIIHKNREPRLPQDSEIQAALRRIWPIQDARVTRRVPYVTQTAIPPLSASETAVFNGWVQLILELQTLRLKDNSSDSYFGYLNPSMGTVPDTTGFVSGLAILGKGVGMAIDLASRQEVGYGEAALANCLDTTVHELGHSFSLDHTPVGGAGSPRLDYPYAGGAIGTLGYAPETSSIYDPKRYFDVMGYKYPRWISDWNYLNALSFIQTELATPIGAPPSAPPSQVIVGGWLEPDGTLHLSPTLHTSCPPAPSTGGDLQLTLTTSEGAQTIGFQGKQLPDLPEGYRMFSFTVPDKGDLLSLEVRSAQGQLLSRKALPPLAPPTVAPSLREADGVLHLTWDAASHPYATLTHEGAVRTTLALHLAGGSAELPVAGLPQGGHYLLHLSDGLNRMEKVYGRAQVAQAQ